MLFTKRRRIVRKETGQDFCPPPNKYIVIPDRKILLFLSVLLILLGVFMFLRSSFFSIKNVFMDGISCSQEEFVNFCKKVDSYKGKNLIFLSEKRTVVDLMSASYLISSVSVNKRYPSDIIFSFEVRVPIVIVRSIPYLPTILATDSGVSTESAQITRWEGSFLADKEGVILGEVQDFSLRLPTLFVPDAEKPVKGKKYGSDVENKAFYLLEALAQDNFNVKDVRFSGDAFIVKLDKGEEAVFSANNDLDLAVASLQVTVHTLTIEGKKYKKIDLRFEKPIVQY